MLVRALLGHVKKSLVVTSLVRVEPYLSGAQKKKTFNNFREWRDGLEAILTGKGYSSAV